MRIGLVIDQFDPRRGGAEQWTWQFAAELLARDHEVHVVSRRFGGRMLEMPIIAHQLVDVRSRIGFAEAAERTLRSFGPEVIHDTGAGWYCNVFQPHGGSRLAAARQNLLLLPQWTRCLKRAASRLLPRYRQFDALAARQYVDDGRIVLALSRRVAADFQRFHAVPPERIRLIYNGVDTQRFSPAHRARYREEVRRRLGIPKGGLLFLLVAHNFRLKGLPTLLRAMSRWSWRWGPVHLAVVGGKRPGRYVRMARRLGVEASVSFVGSVEDTVPFYAAADVYVQPTFYDPCSLAMLEALASGLPVVTSRFNGAGELLTEDVEGHVLADPADVDALLGRLETLQDASLRDRMGRAARELAIEHTLQHNVDEMLEVYEEVARTRPAAAAASMPPDQLPFVYRTTGAAATQGGRQTRQSKRGVPS